MSNTTHNFSRNAFRRGFTIMEMTVSIGILVLVILSVGVIFQNAGRTVGVSQASLEMLSNARGVNQQLEADIAGLDKNAFLVIRSSTFADPSGNLHRSDIVSFISTGTFPHRTGASKTGSPFTDYNPTAPAALITWSQLAMSSASGATALDPADPTKDLPAAQNYKVPLNQVPTGVKVINNSVDVSALTLGRNATLLLPKNQDTGTDILSREDIDPVKGPVDTWIGAFQNDVVAATRVSAVDRNTAPITVNSEATPSDITQSRIDVAATTPAEVMLYLRTGLEAVGGPAAAPRYEVEHFCYRHSALRSVFDTEILRTPSNTPSIPNGYFRMHPIALPGVSSFIVEWSDGSLFKDGDIDPISGVKIDSGNAANTPVGLIGTTRWYGMGSPKGTPTGVDPSGLGTAAAGGDAYSAVFSYHNRANWPTALRFRYHVSDPSGRLANGRDFVEVIKLPG